MATMKLSFEVPDTIDELQTMSVIIQVLKNHSTQERGRILTWAYARSFDESPTAGEFK